MPRDSAAAPRRDSEDIVIVGAGPAGTAAALALAGAGLPCTLLDDNRAAGGQVWRAAAGRDNPCPVDPRGPDLRHALAREPSIDFRREHEVVGLFPDRELWLIDAASRGTVLRPRFVLLATGAGELMIPVPGWARPGVFSLGGLQTLLKQDGLVPPGPVVLGGAGPLLHLVAAQLAARGVTVAAVADASGWPGPGTLLGLARSPALLARGIGMNLTLRRRGVPILRRQAILRIDGAGRPGRVTIGPVGSDGRRVAGREREVEAATVALGFGLVPNSELAALAGCAQDWNGRRGGWIVRHGEFGETSVPGVFVAGDGAGIGGAEHAAATGVLAAAGIARAVGRDLPPRAVAAASRRAARFDRFADALAAWATPGPGLFDLADDATVVCRCERVAAGAIRAAVGAGLTAMGPVKMATRAGMGLCQGRLCGPAIRGLIARTAGQDPAAAGPVSARFPVRPCPIAAFGAPEP